MSKIVYKDFIKENIAPFAADKIVVVNNETQERVGKIVLPSSFKPEYGQRLYRFGLLSDVHFEDSDSQASIDRAAPEDFHNALSFLNNKESVEFTCICGDVGMTHSENELAKYKTTVDTYSPNTIVYTTTGNHDCPKGTPFNEVIWEQYTGHKRLFEFSHPCGARTDHFLFFGMVDGNLGEATYSSADLQWLEGKLEQYKNERTFLFMHVFLNDHAGDMNGAYPFHHLSGNPLNKLLQLHNKYLNSIWFSGHSHWKWALQKLDKKANVLRSYDEEGNPISAWSAHCPSCAYPTDSTGHERIEKPFQSEGGIVDVYENYIDIRGVTFKDEGDADYVTRYLPIADYRLNTPIVKIEEPVPPVVEGELLTAADFLPTDNPKKTSALAEDAGDGYVRLTFTKNQYLTVKSPSWKPKPIGATLRVYDIVYETPAGDLFTQDMRIQIGFNTSDTSIFNHRTMTDGAALKLRSDGYAEICGYYDDIAEKLVIKIKVGIDFTYA